MTQHAKVAPVDIDAADRMEAERLDLEMHARLEAGLIDAPSQRLILSALHSLRRTSSTTDGHRFGRR